MSYLEWLRWRGVLTALVILFVTWFIFGFTPRTGSYFIVHWLTMVIVLFGVISEGKITKGSILILAFSLGLANIIMSFATRDQKIPQSRGETIGGILIWWAIGTIVFAFVMMNLLSLGKRDKED